MTDQQQEWTDKIAAWRESGLSIAEWCLQHNEIYCRKRLEPQHEAVL